MAELAVDRVAVVGVAMGVDRVGDISRDFAMSLRASVRD
jgi:hypothetical protein